ncbi:F-box/kelch-repeat protein At3g06240-like [Rutidosis leptorrhynchoides]|uniref:F-box/kelch-repeat protein At3g06240-like n=1 Tax=Rutidosis leptorrhynchoides TaxID=125765 RepID=UPI003A99EE1D
MSDPNNQMSALSHLPPDLVEAILLFLPVKSLGRFKSVSKRWYSLISGPNFIKTHILNCTKKNPNPNPTHLTLFPWKGDSLCSLDIKQLNTQITPATLTAKIVNFQEPRRWALGSCNGLLLVSQDTNNFWLVNPTTGNTLKLPYSSGDIIDAYGFGYDSSTDDYKFISFYHMRVLDADPESHFYTLNKRRSRVDIICKLRGTKVFALGEKLVLVAVLYDDHKRYFELWVMEEYGVRKSWTKLCTIENNIDMDFQLFAQLSNHDILLGNNIANEIFIYNLDERRCTRVTTVVEGYPEGFMKYGGNRDEIGTGTEPYRNQKVTILETEYRTDLRKQFWLWFGTGTKRKNTDWLQWLL